MNTYTKIVATLGPSSDTYQSIKNIIVAGSRIIRLNFSHGTHLEQQQRVDYVRQVSKELNIPVAIFQDLQGPKIRLENFTEPFVVADGDILILTTSKNDTKDKIGIDYPYLHLEANVGNRILIDDGLISLQVEDIVENDIICRVIEGGIVKPRKGVNLPGVPLHHLSSFTEKDEKDLEFAFKNNLEYVALSFVRSGSDVVALKSFMQKKFGSEIPIISKIEKPEAVENIEAIIEQSSAIMVARGDLGVEMYPEEVPIVQKKIIRACQRAGLPVITATQMLESMMNNPTPTRAETNDVANAVLDGTSAVMLSGETAAGSFALRSVQIMNRIITFTEKSEEFKRLVLDQSFDGKPGELRTKRTTTEAVGFATRELALAIQAPIITCFTHSGSTARRIAKFRPSIQVIAFSPVEKTVNRLALSWGVTPVFIDNLDSIDQLLDFASSYMRENNLAKEGDNIVVTAGVPVGSPGMTNMIRVETI
jgi:pyruvate kinase